MPRVYKRTHHPIFDAHVSDGLSANFNLDAGGSLSHMQVNQDRAGEAPKNYLSPSAGSSQPLPQSERYSSNTRLGTAGQPMSPIFPPERLGAASWGLDPRSSLRHSMIEDQHDDGRRGSKIFVCSFCQFRYPKTVFDQC